MTIAAILGTAALSPVAAAGHYAPDWQEKLVAAGFITVGVAIILAAALLIWGIRGDAAETG